jgi:hypothetical protein
VTGRDLAWVDRFCDLERVADRRDQRLVLIAPRLQALKQFRLGRSIHVSNLHHTASSVHSSAALSVVTCGY